MCVRDEHKNGQGRDNRSSHQRHCGVLQCLSRRVAVVWRARPGSWLEFPVIICRVVGGVRRVLVMTNLHLV